MKVFIVEDETRARQHMEHLLTENFPEVNVVGAVGSVQESVEWLRSNPAPDLIFMDVELSDGTSFEIFNQVEVKAAVVMTTAYDQYAVHAFEVHAVDYLLKPIEVKDLQRAIARVAAGENPAVVPERMREVSAAVVRKEKFLIRLNDRIVPVRTADIAYFYSEAKNSYIVTQSGSSYVMDDSLETIAESLDPATFFRISRSCIISEGAIDSVSKLMGGRLRITVRRGILAATDFTVSRARVDAFLAWLEK